MLQNLQVLRAVAALLVVAHHFLLVNKSAGQGSIASFAHLAELGACGVDLFFCISGYVMLSSIQKKHNFSPKEFAVGRIVRIVPAYWVALTLFILLIATIQFQKLGIASTLADPQFSPDYLISSYLLIPAHNPISNFIQPFLAQGWTLSYELYFYILLMCAAALTKAHVLKTAMLGTALLGLGMLLFWNAGGLAGPFLSNSVVLEFAFGMMVFLITRKTKSFGMAAAVLGVVWLAATTFINVENRVLLWGIPSALILYGFVSLEDMLVAPGLLKSIGDASYSLYLTHGSLTQIYGGLLRRGYFASAMAQNIAVVAGAIIAVLLAFVFYHVIEQPLLQRLSKKRRTVHTVAAG